MSCGFFIFLFFSIKSIEVFFSLFLHGINLKSLKEKKDKELVLKLIDKRTVDESIHYSSSKERYSIISILWDFIFLVLLFAFGVFGQIESYILSFSLSEEWNGVLFVLVFLLMKEICFFPLNWYKTFRIEETFGFNRMGLGLFIRDIILRILLVCLFAIPIVWSILFLIPRFPSSWHWLGFFMVIFYQLFFTWLYPVLIAPMFNRFTPLEEGALKEKIFSLSKQLDYPLSDVYVMDGSKRSSHANAYFTGLGKGKRVVLYDSLIKQMNEDEIIAVLCHEIGHDKLKHIWKGMALSALGVAVFFVISSFLIHWEVLYRSFSLTGDHTFSFLVILPIFLSPFSYFLNPAFNFVSRTFEYEADAFALKAMNQGKSLERALLNLSQSNLSNFFPHPVYSFFYYSHPTLFERIKHLERGEEV